MPQVPAQPPRAAHFGERAVRMRGRKLPPGSRCLRHGLHRQAATLERARIGTRYALICVHLEVLDVEHLLLQHLVLLFVRDVLRATVDRLRQTSVASIQVLRANTAAMILSERCSSPIAAQLHVQNELLWANVALAGRLQRQERHDPWSPTRRLGLVFLQILRDLVLWNVVDNDVLLSPLSRHDARVLSEELPVGLSLLRHAAHLVKEVIRFAIKLLFDGTSERRASLRPVHIELALPRQVESDLIGRIIRELNDIQLATTGPNPIAVHGPEARPNSATVRQALVLQHSQEANGGVPSLVSVDVCGVPLPSLPIVGRRAQAAETHLRGAALRRRDALLEGHGAVGELVGPVDVVYVDEGEVVEKICALGLHVELVVLCRPGAHVLLGVRLLVELLAKE
eukprot:CAMPEP_0170358712 /NCGR_PEP_ID=MMETSP0117_2-20130122/2369_1 /TAXON_ID=400756 /ORGANISM="Durinskia baltica, Strain CSIRO CS-38" /LENGTH=397 /DNA_ID=CAMNT_0010612929 /DNA_START=35 /DNA_END=1229 /DNA_ORIENTATION=-